MTPNGERYNGFVTTTIFGITPMTRTDQVSKELEALTEASEELRYNTEEILNCLCTITKRMRSSNRLLFMLVVIAIAQVWHQW